MNKDDNSINLPVLKNGEAVAERIIANKPHKVGRPTKLTPKRQKVILKAVAQGCTLKSAALQAGIDVTTLNTWKARGKRPETPEDEKFVMFLHAIEYVESGVEGALVSTMFDQAMDGNVAAGKFLLENRFRRDWGMRGQASGAPVQSFEAKLAVAVDNSGDRVAVGIQVKGLSARRTDSEVQVNQEDEDEFIE